MKSFMEEYGKIIVAAIIILLFAIVASPIGTGLRNGVASAVDKLTDNADSAGAHSGVGLVDGPTFNAAIPAETTAIVFTDEKAPAGATLTDVSEAQDMGIVAWMDGTTMNVSTQSSEEYAFANVDSSKMFYNKTNLKSIDTTYLDTSHSTTMFGMFFGCAALTDIDFSGWDTRNVTSMDRMFCNCKALVELDLSSFQTPNLQTTYGMLAQCDALKSVNLSNMTGESLSNVKQMFYKNSSLEKVDLSKLSILGENASVTAMFAYCNNLTQLNLNSYLITSSVIDTSWMFGYSSSDWNDYMQLKTLDVSKWDMSNVTTTKCMFQKCGALEYLDVSEWNLENMKDMSFTFHSCFSLPSLDVSKWNTSSIENMHHLFNACNGITELDVSNWDVSNVTTLNSIFNGVQFEFIDISNWNTSKCESFAQMFDYCHVLKEIKGLEKLNTSSGKNFYEMFEYCYALETLDLSNFDTTNADDDWIDPVRGYSAKEAGISAMDNMFKDMKSLKEIKLGKQFSFNGNGACNPIATLPTPTTPDLVDSDEHATFVEGADGYWYNSSGEAFLPEEIPSCVVDTYYAVKQ